MGILRLVVGRAGYGKTTLCLEEIVARVRREPLGQPLLLLVPAQSTFNMEKELAGRGGSLRAQVYSFRRLAWRVLRETGGLSGRPLDDTGRQMLLKRILMEMKDQLQLLGSQQNQPGFLAALAELVGELKMGCLGAADLESAAGTTPDPYLQRKLQDLALVLRTLEEQMAGRLVDPDDYLNLLARQLPRSRGWRNCQVWVDGFISFTPQEIRVLEALLECCGRVTVTLCLDPAYLTNLPPPGDPFQRSWQTLQQLRRLARSGSVQLLEQVLPGDRRRLASYPERDYLERHFFSLRPPAFAGQAQGQVRILAGASPRAEVEGVVRTLRRQIRQGLVRPGQAAILIRDAGTYLPLLRQILADYEIPCFIDRPLSAMHHPLVELLRSALEVWQKDWAYEPLFRYLKTGLAGLAADEVDRLENYVLAAGVRGSSWYSARDWQYNPFPPAETGRLPSAGSRSDLAEINRLRRRAVRPLRAAQQDWQRLQKKGGISGRQWAGIVLRLCLDLDLPRQLYDLQQAALDAGDPLLYRQHRQVWRAVMDLLDQLVEVLGDVPLRLDELAAVLDAGLAAVRYSLIPPGLDQVIVGDLERTRLPENIRLLFLCGLSEGSLPAAAPGRGILNAAERDRLAALWPDRLTTTGVSLQHEQYLLYRLLSESAGQLWLCYPLGDAEGRARQPAQPLRRLRELLPVPEEVVLPETRPDKSPLEQHEHPGRLLSGLAACWQEARRGEKVHPLWWQVCNVLLERDGWRARLAAVRAGLWEVNQEKPLGGQLAERLWLKKQGGRRILYTSASRLERYASCPFAHFLAHGLGLVERQQHKLAPPDTGRLYHSVLQEFVQQVRSSGREWLQVDDAYVQSACQQLLEKHSRQLQNAILLGSARQRAVLRRLKENLERALRALVRQMQDSAFRPVDCEVRFGTGEAASAPHLELSLPGGELLALAGQIDRLDLAGDAQGRVFFRVVDYKTSPQRLVLPELLAGSQLQLLVYLSAAQQLLAGAAQGRLLPAGAFYMPVHSAPLKLEEPPVPEKLLQEQLKQFCLQGLVVAHEPGFWQLLDSRLGPGVSSLLVPVALTKEGALHKGCLGSVYTRQELGVLQNSLQQLLQMMGRDILDGRVDIAPLRVGKRSACDYCLYYPVCRFDLWLPENRFRMPGGGAGELRQQVTGLASGKGVGHIVLYSLDR